MQSLIFWSSVSLLNAKLKVGINNAWQLGDSTVIRGANVSLRNRINCIVFCPGIVMCFPSGRSPVVTHSNMTTLSEEFFNSVSGEFVHFLIEFHAIFRVETKFYIFLPEDSPYEMAATHTGATTIALGPMRYPHIVPK